MKYSSHVGLSKELLTAKMAFPAIYEFEIADSLIDIQKI